MDFKIPYVYDYITKSCRTHAEVILNHVNLNVRGIEQREARHREVDMSTEAEEYPLLGAVTWQRLVKT
jgi:hypothetical protein